MDREIRKLNETIRRTREHLNCLGCNTKLSRDYLESLIRTKNELLDNSKQLNEQNNIINL